MLLRKPSVKCLWLQTAPSSITNTIELMQFSMRVHGFCHIECVKIVFSSTWSEWKFSPITIKSLKLVLLGYHNHFTKKKANKMLHIYINKFFTENPRTIGEKITEHCIKLSGNSKNTKIFIACYLIRSVNGKRVLSFLQNLFSSGNQKGSRNSYTFGRFEIKEISRLRNMEDKGKL